jgi:Alpha-N-acetylglucosaminidase (NAGLU).
VEKQIILDYFCERQEVWQRTESFFGVPYIWCYLGNFGGNTALVGRLQDLNEKIENTFVAGGDNFQGIGATLEGFDCNPFVYEYILEKAWNNPLHKDISKWTERLADQRVGFVDPVAREAWTEIIDSIYVDSSTPGQACFINQRPNVGKSKTYYSNARLKYDNKHLVSVIGKLLELDGTSHCYEFDLVNLTRQMLANYFGELKYRYDEAYEERDREAMNSISAEMLEIMQDVDDVIGTQSYFLVGKWNADARSWGVDEAEKNYFESNARNLLTTWSDKDMLLNDYASRTWNGLTATFYKVRYEKFFAAVSACLDEGSEWDDAHYKAYSDDVTTFEKQWWDERLGNFPAKPVGDSKSKVTELYEKYKDRI